jgi:hypothetical protein
VGDRHPSPPPATGTVTADRRGVAPVVGKALEVGLVALFVGAVSLSLFGGAVPGYQATAGDRVADRTLAGAAQRVQQAVPPGSAHVSATASVDLPAIIAGDRYDVVVEGRTLVLEHPNPAVDAQARLALPSAVSDVDGAWDSETPARVRVESQDAGLVVRLEDAR